MHRADEGALAAAHHAEADAPCVESFSVCVLVIAIDRRVP